MAASVIQKFDTEVADEYGVELWNKDLQDFY